MLQAQVQPSLEHGLDCLEALAPGHQATVVESVDVETLALTINPHDEVSGQPDALGGEPQATANLHVDHRQGDGDAKLAVHHLAQVAVAWVVVVVLVACKAATLEQIVAHRVGKVSDVGAGGRGHMNVRRHGIQRVQIALHVYIRVSLSAD